MIFIIDNGQSYSSHSLYFVDTDMPADFVRRYIKASGDDAFVVAVSDGTEWLWLEGGPCDLLQFSIYGETEESLIAEYYANESERVLRAMAGREEAHRLSARKEHEERKNPAHRYHRHPVFSPRTPAIDALVSRGLVKPNDWST